MQIALPHDLMSPQSHQLYLEQRNDEQHSYRISLCLWI